VTTPAISPDEVEAQARATIPARQQATPQLILARSELQFGQYRGQTFQWLLEHAVGYAAGLIDSVQKELQPEVDTHCASFVSMHWPSVTCRMPSTFDR